MYRGYCDDTILTSPQPPVQGTLLTSVLTKRHDENREGQI